MTVMDVQSRSALTSELTQLALAFRRNTEGNLRLFPSDAFPVLTQHFDMVSAAARALCATEAAVQEFIKTAEIPDAEDWLKLAR
jgi:hypothetical protein